MPTRIRNAHLANVVEAIIEYTVAGGEMSFSSDYGEDGDLVISFDLMKPADYHAILDRLTAERPPGEA